MGGCDVQVGDRVGYCDGSEYFEGICMELHSDDIALIHWDDGTCAYEPIDELVFVSSGGV
jgi:hypothetical protein